jgi:hypothetical protein
VAVFWLTKHVWNVSELVNNRPKSAVFATISGSPNETLLDQFIDDTLRLVLPDSEFAAGVNHIEAPILFLREKEGLKSASLERKAFALQEPVGNLGIAAIGAGVAVDGFPVHMRPPFGNAFSLRRLTAVAKQFIDVIVIGPPLAG